MKLHHAMDEYLVYVEVEKNCSSHTVQAYAFDLACFEAFLKKYVRSCELADITSSTIRCFIQDQVLNHNMKRARFNAGYPVSSHSAVFAWQLLRYLENDRHPYALRNEALFKLLATSGMRRSEIVALTWAQLDLNEKTLLIYGKGKKERLLPFIRLHFLPWKHAAIH
ncbi:tyrosine-type recombinase/integrase [Virgibacillus kekensis]|uniref:Tyrosine-type recombinase/integrase n=1 Tax=Virgibacillus kekensis TaxID=202261 RepID=A0ABV9DGW3_9BACI